jgi:hypothetical protein
VDWNRSSLWTRRRWLGVGLGTGLGLTLSTWPREVAGVAQAKDRPPGFGRAKSVILVYANGGQSQLETWDPKPDAPREIRGEFAAIPTAVPGVRFTEHLPRLASLADRFTVIRSVSHDDLDHGSATYLALTGRHHPRKSSNPPPGPNDIPTLGAALRRVRPATNVPYTAVHVNAPALVPELPAPGQDGGVLGREYEPLRVGDLTGDPAALPSLSLPADVSLARLGSRRALLTTIDGARGRLADDSALSEMDGLYGSAYRLLETPQCREAFDLSAEPRAVQERYGRHRAGLACLLARRLAQAEVPLITVIWNHSARGQDKTPDDPDSLGWDTHNDLFEVMGRHLLPRFDQTFSALLEDLERTGLLDQTLVVCMGEFGRAPRVAVEPRFAGQAPGRKHWANVYSIVMAGAGVARGAVFGASDAIAAYPTADRVGPWDVAATIVSALGVDPALEYRDAVGRVFPLTVGKPIVDLYSG